MNINEVEIVTGLTRANIRYYEKEGLIEVERLDNRYRNYSTENIKALRKIILLRRLGLSVDTIRKIKNGETDMTYVLRERIDHINSNIDELRTAKAICGKMIEDNIGFENFEPLKYMELFESKKDDITKRDIADEKGHPWRRFLAYATDIFFYDIIISIIIVIVGRNITIIKSIGVLFHIFTIVLALFAESLLLSHFGTTLGKRIFGIYVFGYKEEKISYRKGLERCFYRLRYGLGFYIPIYILYRLYKSYVACEESEIMHWDDETDTEVKIKSFSWKNIIVWIASMMIAFAVMIFTILALSFPPNKGGMTPEQFVENYNYISEYRGFESLIETYGSGKFKKVPPEMDEHTIYLDNDMLEDSIYYRVDENGYISEIWYESLGDAPVYFNSWTNDEYVIMWSFMMADKNVFTYSQTEDFILQAIEKPFESNTYFYDGFTVVKEVENNGYYIVSDDAVMKSADDGSFSIKWSISRNAG